MSDRNFNEIKYNENKSDNDEMYNIVLCSRIADESALWNPNEAVYWRKKAIEKIEKLNGKTHIQNTIYYDKISENLLDKGSYKEAIKWNNKSIKIKIKMKGDASLDLLINMLNMSEAYLLLRDYEKCIIYSNKAMDILNNCEEESECIYKAYLKLVYIWGSYNIYAEYHKDAEVSKKNVDDIANRAIQISEKIYGEESIETAEAYRMKAVSIDKFDYESRLRLLKKALMITIKMEEQNLNKLTSLFYDIQNTWEGESKLKNAVYWSANNISNDFVLKATQNFPKFKQEQIKEMLAAM